MSDWILLIPDKRGETIAYNRSCNGPGGSQSSFNFAHSSFSFRIVQFYFSQSSFSSQQSSFSFAQSSFNFSPSSFKFHSPVFHFAQSTFNFHSLALKFNSPALVLCKVYFLIFRSPVLILHSPVLILWVAQIFSLLRCLRVVPFCDGCHYTENRGLRNETFSFHFVRKSDFFGSGIVRLGYDRTNIFIVNGEPPFGATESCEESR